MKNKIYFIVAVGRSGTKYASKFLNESSNISAFHEPDFKEDFINYQSKFFNKRRSEKSFMEYKEQQIKKRLKVYKKYVEVNGVLRLHIEDLKKAFNCKVYGLIRNGKDVVRSIVSKSGSVANGLAKEKGMNLFEFACYQWAHDNKYIIDHCDVLFKFEDIVSDYFYASSLLNCINFNEMPFTTFEYKKYAKKKINKTAVYKIGKYDAWSDSQKKIFKKYCSSLMERMNYEL